GIGPEVHDAGLLQQGQCLDHGGELHAVVGGGGLSAGELPAVGAVHQNRAPAAGARIAGAGAVGVDGDCFHHEILLEDGFEWGSRLLGNSSPCVLINIPAEAFSPRLRTALFLGLGAALLMVCERQGDHVIPLLLEPHDDDALSGPARGADAVHRGADQDACLGHQQQVLRAVHHLDAHHGAGLVRHHVVLDAEAAPVGDPIVLHRRLLAVAVFRDGQHRMID
ncbi:hypothetical protein MCGFDL_MCGFDL_00160, partial [Dysosmobacter welbionis]